MIILPAGQTPTVEQKDNSFRRIQALFKSCPHAIQIFDLNGECVEVNPAWEKLWATDAKNLAGYNALKDPEIEKRGIMEDFKKAFEGQVVELPPFFYNTPETDKPGRSRWIKSTAFPITDEENRVFEVALIMEDITNEKIEQAKLEEDNEELASINSAMTDELKLEQVKQSAIEESKKTVS